MVPFDSRTDQPGVITDDCLTADAGPKLTGYNIQHIRRLVLSGKLEAQRIGRSWLIKISSLEHYLEEVVGNGDRRFGKTGLGGENPNRTRRFVFNGSHLFYNDSVRLRL